MEPDGIEPTTLRVWTGRTTSDTQREHETRFPSRQLTLYRLSYGPVVHAAFFAIRRLSISTADA